MALWHVARPAAILLSSRPSQFAIVNIVGVICALLQRLADLSHIEIRAV